MASMMFADTVSRSLVHSFFFWSFHEVLCPDYTKTYFLILGKVSTEEKVYLSKSYFVEIQPCKKQYSLF